MEPEQPPPARPIPYFEDAAETEPWSRVVKVVAVVAVVVAGADVLSVGLQMLPRFGGPAIRPFNMIGNRQIWGVEFVYVVAGWAMSAVLLAAGIACLARARLGRTLMLGYAFGALAHSALMASVYAFYGRQPGV